MLLSHDFVNLANMSVSSSATDENHAAAARLRMSNVYTQFPFATRKMSSVTRLNACVSVNALPI